MNELTEIAPENPYRIEVRVRNNLILRRIDAAGHTSIADFCRKFGIQQTVLGALINFKKLPIKDNGDWISSVYDLSSALRCEPEHLFTERQKTLIAKRRHTIEMSEMQFVDSLESGRLQKQMEAQDIIKKISTVLTPREQDIMDKTFKESMTTDEIGAEQGVSCTRINQLQHKALRKMKAQFRKLEREQKERQIINEIEVREGSSGKD